eukprot:m.342739 g.342739  ORF g.342739 m.342739 type:complete len:257 (+) comp21769_c0_seq1:157-927(+)
MPEKGGELVQSSAAPLQDVGAKEINEFILKSLSTKTAEALAGEHEQAVQVMQICSKHIGDSFDLSEVSRNLVPVYKELLSIRRVAGEVRVIGAAKKGADVTAALESARLTALGKVKKSQELFDAGMAEVKEKLNPLLKSALPLQIFLQKVEAEYLHYTSEVVRSVSMRKKAESVFESLAAECAKLQIVDPIRLGCVFSHARFLAGFDEFSRAVDLVASTMKELDGRAPGLKMEDTAHQIVTLLKSNTDYWHQQLSL